MFISDRLIVHTEVLKSQGKKVKKSKVCEKPERKRIGCSSQRVIPGGPRPSLVARLNLLKEGEGEKERSRERERERGGGGLIQEITSHLIFKNADIKLLESHVCPCSSLPLPHLSDVFHLDSHHHKTPLPSFHFNVVTSTLLSTLFL